MEDIKKALLKVFVLPEADKRIIRKAKSTEELVPFMRKLGGGSMAKFFLGLGIK